MSLLRANFLSQPLFATSQEKDVLPSKWFWIALIAAFLIVNARPKRISPLVLELLQAVPEKWLGAIFQQLDVQAIANSIVLLVIVPLKKVGFFVALLVIGSPIARCLYQSGPFWEKLGWKRIAWSSLLMFCLLSALALPYGDPAGPVINRFGLSGLGVLFGEMSVAPFSSNNDFVYGRLLKPALANYLHMDGFARYYVFSLACTYLLIVLTLTFLELKIATDTVPGHIAELPSPKVRAFVYLSAMTSSFVMTSFQWPGYADNLVFIFILLMACIPMTSRARLGTVALCLVTHEAIALTLVPIIAFWFPKGEKARALLVIGLFYVVLAASYGLNASQVLAGHGTTVGEASVWKIILAYPGHFILGLFFSYKLLWLYLFYVLRRLWAQNQFEMVLGLVATVLFPVSLCFLAWDTTRIGGAGFLGMLIALVILMRDFRHLSTLQARFFLAGLCVNVLIPSYNLILYPPVGDGPPDYPYLGLYRLLHSAVRMFAP